MLRSLTVRGHDGNIWYEPVGVRGHDGNIWYEPVGVPTGVLDAIHSSRPDPSS
jgi:hypothetical protein